MVEKSPWYLRKKFLYCICILTPPIGYIVLVTNLKKLKQEEKINLLTISTIMMSIWVLKFLPKNIELYVCSFILAILFGNDILERIKGKK
ncbi:hypothetical protein SFC55_07635 [Niallia taxi]|uniref:hypothetical protein n=1 Tax=Niallia TaxID=2837506 RepID=UPI00203DC673|nr:hypothetical protein [Niallia sp. MER 6]MCM3029549.1 hypothetical protein [Niallia sp. MER 6]